MNDRELHILLVVDDEVDVMNVQRALVKNHIANPVHAPPMASRRSKSCATVRSPAHAGSFCSTSTCPG
jgi:hypothetical protein